MDTNTKIQQILSNKDMSQADLMRIIKERTGVDFDKGNMSRIVNGIKTNFTIETARIISEALCVTIDDIID